MKAIELRLAVREDVPAIVALLADDGLGSQREGPADPPPEAYYRAFDALDADSNMELIVADQGGEIVGTLQFMVLVHMTYRGGRRGQIEGVRVARSLRGSGLGRRMLDWAVNRAKERGCHLVQLTTDKTRPDAIRFYEQLGFKATHEGMKLHL